MGDTLGWSHRRQSLLAALGAFAVALLGAAALNLANTWLSSRSELVSVARSIDDRSLRVRNESLALGKKIADDESCDPAHLRRLLSTAHYVKNIGKIRGTRVYCDALDGPEASIELGPPDVVRDDGIRVWATGRGLWAARGHNAVVMDPMSFVDAVLPPDTVVALLEAESGKMFVHSDPLPHGLFKDAWEAGPGIRVQGEYLTAVSRSSDQRTLEIAARPLAAVRHAASIALPRFLLAGALFGLLLGATVYIAMGRRRTLMSELRRALKRGHLHSVLQPIIHLEVAGAPVVGFECLARWCMRDGAEIPPTVFVPMIEQAGLGADLARCMAANLVQDFSATLKEFPGIYVALNLSSDDVADPRVLDEVDRLLAAGDVNRAQVVIELTERTFEAIGLEAGLERLRRSGHRLSIDDFGTGASNASRLATLQPDMVKIDRSFLLHAEGGSLAASLLPQLVAMARSCGAKVVIEGVETRQQAARVLSFGNVFAQGYYWHRPMGAAQARTLLAAEAAERLTPAR